MFFKNKINYPPPKEQKSAPSFFLTFSLQYNHSQFYGRSPVGSNEPFAMPVGS